MSNGATLADVEARIEREARNGVPAQVKVLTGNLCKLLRALPAARIEPCGDRVLAMMVEEPAEEMLASGIIINRNVPGAATKATTRCLVLAVGPKVNDDATRPQLVAGSVIVCGHYVGQDINREGIPHRLIKREDILGVIE